MKFSALFTLVVFLTVMIFITPSFSVELPSEIEENYRFMGMTEEEIISVKEELKNVDRPNYVTDTEKKFYCSHLVWTGFKNKYNIDLNGGQYGKAIYPPEIIDSGYVYRIYIKWWKISIPYILY